MKTKVLAIRHQSASNPDRTYETIIYSDGSTSCNCPGWIYNRARSCKHTREAAGRIRLIAVPAVSEQQALTAQLEASVAAVRRIRLAEVARA